MRVDTSLADHEAAHIVVGVALGLPLKVASINPTRWRGIEIAGYVWFGGFRNRLAHGIAVCAGLVWEARPGGTPAGAAGDLVLAREYLRTPIRGGSTAVNVDTGCRIASELLSSRRKIHARVARELCDRDLRPRDLLALVLGG